MIYYLIDIVFDVYKSGIHGL